MVVQLSTSSVYYIAAACCVSKWQEEEVKGGKRDGERRGLRLPPPAVL